MIPIYFSPEEQDVILDVIEYTCNDTHMQKPMWQSVIVSMDVITDVILASHHKFANNRFVVDNIDATNLYCAVHRFLDVKVLEHRSMLLTIISKLQHAL